MLRKEESRRYYLKHRDQILKRVTVYRDKNRAKIRKWQREKYATNHQFREEMNAYQVKYREENKKKISENNKKYQKTHAESLREYHNDWKRKWGKTPAGKMASSLKGYRRRAILKKDIGTHTDTEWQEILRIHKNRCAICKKKRKLTKDHIKALSKEGKNTADNLQPLCSPCNARKGNRKLSTVLTLHKRTVRII